MRTQGIASAATDVLDFNRIAVTASALQRRFREPSLTVLLLLQVLTIFVARPLGGMHVLPSVVSVLLNAALVIVVILVTSAHRLAQLTIIASVGLGVLAWLLMRVEPSPVMLALDFGSRVIFLAALSAILLGAIFGDEEGTYHRIQGGIAVYLNIAVMFALLYGIADLFDRHAFSMQPSLGSDLGRFIYFSFATLTTTGYGDIVPVNPLVRSAANLEAVVGELFTAILLARLVSRYFTRPSN